MKILITESQYDLLVEQVQNLKQVKVLPYLTFRNQDYGTFIKILKQINVPVTPENIAFMYAWRECENSLGAQTNKFCNNPFNTTWDTDKNKSVKFCSPQSTMFCTTNPQRVKSYKTIDWGIYATVQTIKSGRYQFLIEMFNNSKKYNWTCLDMINNIGNKLQTSWGTNYQSFVNTCKKYLNGKIPSPSVIKKSGCQ